MKHTMSKLLIFLLIMAYGCSLIIYAESPQNEPFGDPHAVRGGQLNLGTSDFPKSFNYFTTNTADTHEIFQLVYETLMEYNPYNLEYEPLIANIEVSADKRIYTVKIDPRARWADGKPITSADVKFTYDTIMNPKNLTSVMRLFFSRFNSPQIVDKLTIKFIAKIIHFKNLDILATSLNVLPKHLFQGKDFNKAFNMSLPPGSGPYVLSEVKEGRYYTLTRRKDYWGDQLPSHRGMYNFTKIKFKVIDENVFFEAFKKGDFDIAGATAKRWATETNSEQFKKNWIIKRQVYNYTPEGPYGLVFNMRRPVFQDLRVRQALFYLLDRKKMIEKIMYNAYKPLTSYWPHLYHDGEASNPLIEYNPGKAKELLRQAGYTKLDKEGYLINSKGERLEFTITYVSESFEKHLTFYVDTCKQAGVKVNLELLSYASFQKRQDEYKYDMVLMAWSGDMFEDPEQLWHSKHVDDIGGSNLPGYKNNDVDRLIESMPLIFDMNKRNEILKKIDHIIYRDVPYILFWDADYSKILYKNIFGMPKTLFTKYSIYSSTFDIYSYWWIDPVKQKRYRDAITKNNALPAEPLKVYYDDKIKK